ncbi:MAG: glycosyltransferase family 4 protein [Patulibacter sp.]|nr:glycosyltransferase family 4 protein [Patulibacter sp.]
MHVRIVDPSAYTPPYDHALCAALARAGDDVILVTSDFPYGEVPEPDGYAVERGFYRRALGPAGSRVRQLTKLPQHPCDMWRLARSSRAADVVHFQWLPLQAVDLRLLGPRSPLPWRGPLVLTAHDVLPREAAPGQRDAQRRLYARMDAVIVHSRHGRDRLVDDLGVPDAKVHLIPHGAFAHLTELEPAPLPDELATTPPGRPVVLLFGLIRPYKGLDVLLEAWRALAAEGDPGADLWVVGLPKTDIAALRQDAPPSVRFVDRFVSDAETAAVFRRADVVVLPYREIDQSGVLFTALAFGRAMVLSDVGGFPEVAAEGAAELVPAGQAGALAATLRAVLDDAARRDALADRSAALAAGPYSWDAIAAAHQRVYASLADGSD